MNAALIRKTARDTLPLLLLCAVAMFGFEFALLSALNQVGDQIVEIMRRLTVARKIIQVLTGVDLEQDLSYTTLVSLSLVDGWMVAVMAAFMITTCTRVIAAEVERGTADLLLTLPFRRSTAFFSVSLVWIVGAVLLTFTPFVGLAMGNLVFKAKEPLEFAKLWWAAPHICGFMLAIGGIATCFASTVERRSTAVGIVVGMLIVSVFLNVLEAFSSVFAYVRYLGILHYYRPVDVVRAGGPMSGTLGALLAIGLVFWLLGLRAFCRRDIPAA